MLKYINKLSKAEKVFADSLPNSLIQVLTFPLLVVMVQCSKVIICSLQSGEH